MSMISLITREVVDGRQRVAAVPYSDDVSCTFCVPAQHPMRGSKKLMVLLLLVLQEQTKSFL